MVYILTQLVLRLTFADHFKTLTTTINAVPMRVHVLVETCDAIIPRTFRWQ